MGPLWDSLEPHFSSVQLVHYVFSVSYVTTMSFTFLRHPSPTLSGMRCQTIQVTRLDIPNSAFCYLEFDAL